MRQSRSPQTGPVSDRPARHVRPRLEALEDRLVPSASVLNLTQRGSEGVLGGAIFRQADAVAADSVDPFLRLKDGCGGTEQGYNTDARPLQFDQARSRDLTHSLKLGDVPVVVIDGVSYREFVLDVREPAFGSGITLDQLRLFASDAPNLRNYRAGPRTLGGEQAVYDLDAGGNRAVKLDARLNRGDGTGDMLFYVRDSVFAGESPDSFVYLYSRFGDTVRADGGAETWSVRQIVEPPAQLGSLSGFVYQDANGNGVRDAGELGVGGTEIAISGVDADGNGVFGATFTVGMDGFFHFEGLPPGTYTIEKITQFEHISSGQSVGSLGGDIGTDVFTNIVVGPGQNGVDYNFGELPNPGGG